MLVYMTYDGAACGPDGEALFSIQIVSRSGKSISITEI